MTEIIKIIDDYRKELDLEARYKYANWIHSTIVDPLSLFIFDKVPLFAAEEVLHETLKAIVINLGKFQGKTDKQFYSWCYRIARNKASDHHRGKFRDRLDPLPLDELWQLVEAADTKACPLSPEDRMDLEFALNLLAKSKPECRDFLWKYYVIGLDYGEIGEEFGLKSDAARMRIDRCMDTAQSLMADCRLI